MLYDYHAMAPEVHEAMTFLHGHLPDHLDLVMAPRSDPPLPLARLGASLGTPTGIGQKSDRAFADARVVATHPA